MKPARAVMRWDLWLPGAGLLVAGMLVVLAVTTERAQRDRHAVALEGRLLRLAHRLEETLRDEGPEAAAAALAEELDANAALIEGLALLGPDDEVETEVGSPTAAQAIEVELFLGRGWRIRRGWQRGATPGRRGGQRALRLQPTAAARARPLSERLLLPVVVGAALILVALSVLGGVLLIRQQQEVERRAARQRLEGLARAGAGLAHQLRNPLATIKGSCQLLLESAPAGSVKRLEAVLA